MPNWLDWGIADSEAEAWESILGNEDDEYGYIGWRIERIEHPTDKETFELVFDLHPATPYDGPDGEERYRREFGYED